MAPKLESGKAIVHTSNWKACPGGAKPACHSTLEGQKHFFLMLISMLRILLGGKTIENFHLGPQPPVPPTCTRLPR